MQNGMPVPSGQQLSPLLNQQSTYYDGFVGPQQPHPLVMQNFVTDRHDLLIPPAAPSPPLAGLTIPR